MEVVGRNRERAFTDGYFNTEVQTRCMQSLPRDPDVSGVRPKRNYYGGKCALNNGAYRDPGGCAASPQCKPGPHALVCPSTRRPTGLGEPLCGNTIRVGLCDSSMQCTSKVVCRPLSTYHPH